jgi:hypothetical protein
MNDPDSISDPVARRIRYTGSYPSARSSAPIQLGALGSTWLGSRVMTWQVGPTLLTCQLTGRWHVMPTVHVDITLTSGWCHPWHANCACWHHNYVMLTSSISELVAWVGSGQPIRVKKTRGARLRAWANALPESDGECGHVRRPILTSFSPVASSLPPLHSGMVKRQFWQLSFLSKIKHPFKPCALIPIVGDSGTPMRGPVMYWYLLLRGLKHTETIFYVVRQNRLHPRERVIVLEIEKGLQ